MTQRGRGSKRVRLSKKERDKLFYFAARAVTWIGHRQPEGWPKLIEYVELLATRKG